MYNVIKSQNFQTLRDYPTYIIPSIFLARSILIYCGTLSYCGLTPSGSLWLMNMLSDITFTVALFSIYYSWRICGWDLSDKTINNEIVSGTKRSAVYFGRFIPALLWSIAVYAAMVILPTLFITAVWGFSAFMHPKGAVIRCLLLLIPILRYVCVTAALNMATLDNRLSAVLAGLYPLIEIFADDPDKKSLVLDGLMVTRTAERFADTSLKSFEYVDTGDDVFRDITALQETLTFSDGLTISLISVGASVIILIAGFLIFRKRDLK